MTKQELEEQAQALVRAHHDAFLVELLGVEGSGLLPARIDELIEMGIIEDTDINKLAGEMGLDPLLLLRAAGHIMDQYPESRDALRRLSVGEWTTLVSEWMKMQDVSDIREIMSPMQTPDSPASGRVVTLVPPDWMTPAERGAHLRTYIRVGEYATQLGNKMERALVESTSDVWAKEETLDIADPIQRQRQLEIDKDKAASELATRADVRALASSVDGLTDKYIRNWDMITQTELQGAHNEGRAIAAIELAGEEGAFVARINNSNACKECVRLFRNEDGTHKVFSIAELEANGTNEGRLRENWLPTLYPVHPNCECDTIPVPVGFYVDSVGRLFPHRGNSAERV